MIRRLRPRAPAAASRRPARPIAIRWASDQTGQAEFRRRSRDARRWPGGRDVGDYGDQVKLPNALIAGALYDTLKPRGITAAVTRYRDLKSNHAQDYGFDEPVLDQLGHQLLERKKVREAIEIFKLNVEAYPASADVYDSLGEAYKSAGERELAIQNYRKALEMNPKNENAAKALKELDQK